MRWMIPKRAVEWSRSPVLAAALSLGAVLCGMSGCQPAPPPPPPATEPAMPSPDKIAELRQSYQQQAPGTLVGEVVGVLTSDRLAAVGDVPAQEFKEGDYVTFVDMSRKVINRGRVVRVVNDLVDVKYEPGGVRPPRDGDLAIKLKSVE